MEMGMQIDPATPRSASAGQIRVWDAPTRLFHWSIVALVTVSWLSADQGYMTVHLWSGLSLLALLLFRLGWGVLGSTTSRFSDFLHPPHKILAYLRTQARGARVLHAGHNPAGGLMVVALLAVLLAQVATGLFANDGLKFSGPLALLVSDDASDRLTRIHGIIFNVILVLVWLHVVAVGFHHFVKGNNLVGPMVSGKKHQEHVPEGITIIIAHPALALGLLLASAAVMAWILF
jgi:cytochrome b